MSETALATIDRARRALEAARTVEEVIDLRDQAAAVAYFLRQRQASLEAQNAAAELKLRCERRIGELLGPAPPPGRPRADEMSDDGHFSDLSRQDVQRLRRMADVPAEKFDAHLQKLRAEGYELTTAAVLRLWAELNREPPEPKSADWRDTPVEDLGLPRLLAVACATAGVRTAGQLQDRLDTGDRLGVLPYDVAVLRGALAEARGESGDPCPTCHGTGRAH